MHSILSPLAFRRSGWSKRARRSFAGALLLASAAGLPAALAAEERALVIQSSGETELVRDGQARNLTELMEREPFVAVTDDDLLRTAAASRIVLQFESVQAIIAADSEVRIAEILRSLNERNTLRMQLTRGEIGARAESGGSSSVIVETPTATASVRGTEFIVLLRDADQSDPAPPRPDASAEENATEADMAEGTEEADDAAADEPEKEQVTEVLVASGTVDVENQSGQRLAVQAGQKAIADARDLRRSILADFEKRKFEIFQEFDRIRQETRKAIEEQREKGKELLDELKR